MRVRIYQLLILVVLLMLWQWLATCVVERGVFFYGSPSSVGEALKQWAHDGSLVRDVWATFVAALIGFAVGNLAGIVFGLSLWFSRTLANIVRPYVTVLGSIPILAVSPILIIWLGIGLTSKIAIASLATFVVALVQAYEGARHADKDYEELLYSMGARHIHVFRMVVVPSSLIWVIAAFRLNVGFALLGTFIGEFISAEAGLGFRIIRAMGLFNIPLVLAGVLMFGAIALVLSLLVEYLERRMIPWRAVGLDVRAGSATTVERS